MQRRAIGILVAGFVLLASVAAAVVLLGPPRIPLTHSANDVDKVTLYQNGLAFVELTRDFQSPGGESLLVIPLPLAARLDSLAIEGGDVTLLQVRGSSPEDGSLKPGDAVVVHVEDGKTFRGSYAGRQGSALVLATESGTTLVEASRVVAIDLTGRALPDETAGSREALALVRAEPGARSVRVTYLAQGPGWTPSYELDVETGHLVFRATLTGLDDWRNVSLDLVSGAPHVVLTPRAAPSYAESYDARLAAAPAPKGDDVGASTPLGELHRYHYARPLSVSRGETVRVLVEEGTLEIVSHRLDADVSTGWGGVAGARQEVDVLERLEVRNTLDEPLPPGIVLAYREGTWIGEDMLAATPKGERANVTLAKSEDLVARLTLESYESTGTRDKFSYVLTLTNRKDTSADMQASLSYPTYRTLGLTFEPTPDETAGGRALWRETLQPGATASYRVRYEMDRS